MAYDIHPGRPKTVFRKVLEQFTRNVGGSIVHGDPKSADPAAKTVELTLEQADILAELKLVADKNSAAPSEAEDTDVAEGEGKGLDGGDTGAGDENPDGARRISGASSAQAVREARVSGEPAAAQQTTRGRGRYRSTKTDAPAGGRSTTATTHHPATDTSPFRDGAAAGQDEDAAPTGGDG